MTISDQQRSFLLLVKQGVDSSKDIRELSIHLNSIHPVINMHHIPKMSLWSDIINRIIEILASSTLNKEIRSDNILKNYILDVLKVLGFMFRGLLLDTVFSNVQVRYSRFSLCH